MRNKRITGGNSGLAKFSVQWLNLPDQQAGEALLMSVYFFKVFVSPPGLCFVSSFVVADLPSLRCGRAGSFVLTDA